MSVKPNEEFQRLRDRTPEQIHAWMLQRGFRRVETSVRAGFTKPLNDIPEGCYGKRWLYSRDEHETWVKEELGRETTALVTYTRVTEYKDVYVWRGPKSKVLYEDVGLIAYEESWQGPDTQEVMGQGSGPIGKFRYGL